MDAAQAASTEPFTPLHGRSPQRAARGAIRCYNSSRTGSGEVTVAVVSRTWTTAGLLALALAAGDGEALGQIPDKFENLQHLPKDITRPVLVQRMREFSFALGVRCQHCHTGGDGVSFRDVDFKSDEKAAKRKARFMLKLLDELNAKVADVPARRQPAVRIDCVTCHRGLPVPMTLATHLTEVIAADGIDAAVRRYRDLRRDEMSSGRYDFGEWSINELARQLREAGNAAAAIAMLEVNGEFHPRSPAIDIQLAELHLSRRERDRAIVRLKAALEKDPKNQMARTRLAELESQTSPP
jgi:hypothetical protein